MNCSVVEIAITLSFGSHFFNIEGFLVFCCHWFIYRHKYIISIGSVIYAVFPYILHFIIICVAVTFAVCCLLFAVIGTVQASLR